MKKNLTGLKLNIYNDYKKLGSIYPKSSKSIARTKKMESQNIIDDLSIGKKKFIIKNPFKNLKESGMTDLSTSNENNIFLKKTNNNKFIIKTKAKNEIFNSVDTKSNDFNFTFKCKKD